MPVTPILPQGNRPGKGRQSQGVRYSHWRAVGSPAGTLCPAGPPPPPANASEFLALLGEADPVGGVSGEIHYAVTEAEKPEVCGPQAKPREWTVSVPVQPKLRGPGPSLKTGRQRGRTLPSSFALLVC